MVDHWKALANRLGTPGIDDEPTHSETPEPPVERKTAERKPAEKDASPAVAAAQETPPTAPTAVPPPEFHSSPAISAEADKSTKKRRSSWEALANLFNVSVPREAPAKEEPVPPARPAQSPAAQFPPASKAPATSEPPVARQKPGKATGGIPDSFDAMFKTPEATSSSPLDDMFDQPADTLKLEGWGKPRRMVDDVSGWDEPIDATDSDEDDVVGSSPASSTMARDAVPAEDDAEEPRRRRRRRGRRGRSRDDSVTEKQADEPVFDENDVSDRSSTPVSWAVDTLDVESADSWDEPESFGVDDYEQPASSRLDDLEEDEESGEVLRRSSRRRRRRGGRGRDEDARDDRSSDQPRSERPGRELPAGRSASSERQRPPRPARDVDSPAEKSATRKDYDDDLIDKYDDSDDDFTPREVSREATREGGRERSGRERGPRETRNRDRDTRTPSRDVAGRELEARDLETREPREDREGDGRRRRGRKPTDSASRLSSSHPELEAEYADGEETSDAKPHRNIPTWNDALEAIIQANTENHKRNEGRGGGGRSGGGGRPRGRR